MRANLAFLGEGLRLFFKDQPKFTMNLIMLVLSISQAVLLLMVATMMGWSAGVYSFCTTGVPNPCACGPLFVVWTIVLVLYWRGIVKSPILSTVVAAVFVYFGTTVLLSYSPFGPNWPTFIHVLEAYIGYGYFIESAVCGYRLW